MAKRARKPSAADKLARDTERGMIRTPGAAQDLVGHHLAQRGVSSIVLPQWGQPFTRLMRTCLS